MLIVCVDDSDERSAEFYACLVTRLGEKYLRYVSAADFIDNADESTLKASLLLLDYDLCVAGRGKRCPNTKHERLYCGCRTGLDVAKYLVRKGYRKNVIVHALPSEGATQMVEVLKGTCKVEHVPFYETSALERRIRGIINDSAICKSELTVLRSL
jgi:hypothetical protein